MALELVLASGSPRRAELLRQVGLSFRVVVPDVDESTVVLESASNYVTRIAGLKLQAARRIEGSNLGNIVILCADTVVEVDGQILGKPVDEADGVRMLSLLSGRDHKVLTAVAVTDRQRSEIFITETVVQFRQIPVDEQHAYWASGEPRDKAGGYGGQGIGAMFIASLSGSFSNVVGLPLCETVESLRRFGISCLGLVAKGPGK